MIAEIAAVDTVLTVLHEGSTREAEEKRKVRLEYKKFLLENRKESYGAVALLEKELDLERVNKQLDEVNIFINAVQHIRLLCNLKLFETVSMRRFFHIIKTHSQSPRNPQLLVLHRQLDHRQHLVLRKFLLHYLVLHFLHKG